MFVDNPQLCCVSSSNPPTNIDGDGLHRPRGVIGLTTVERHLYVVYHGYDTIEVFDQHCTKMKDIKVDDMYPHDMVGSELTRQLYISDGNDVIRRVSVDTGKSEEFVKLIGSIQYLSLVKNHLLVTSSHLLWMFDIISGEKFKSIVLPEDKERGDANHVIETNRNTFIVSYSSFTLREIDSNGREIRVFDSNQQLRCRYMSLDSVGRLLVTDYKNRCVVLFDEHLNCKRILIDAKRLDDAWPRRLNYDKKNKRMAVGLDNGHVKIFQC